MAYAVSAHLATKPKRHRRPAAIEKLLLVLLAGLAVWKGLLPGWRDLNTDFPNYYVAAQLMRSHYCLDRLYDWIWFQRIAGRFGVDHQLAGFLGLTPFSALPIIPFTLLPILEAKRAWLVCNIALLAGTVHLLSWQCGLTHRRAWLIALCAVIPLRTSFLFGQMHIAVLALLAAAYIFHMRGRQTGSGCCIALAAALKIYPIFFCIYFVVKRRWMSLASATLCAGVCFITSYLTAGPDAVNTYLLQQLPRSLQGESGNPFLSTLTSSSALFHRLFLYEPELNPHPLVPSPGLYALLFPLWQAALAAMIVCRLRPGFHAGSREALEWPAFLCLLVFLSSAPASYQFVVLIAAAIPSISSLLQQQRKSAAVVFFCLYLAACNLRTIPIEHSSAALMPLSYVKLWSGVALIAFYSWILKPNELIAAKRTGLRYAAVICGLWIAGAFGAWLHVKDLGTANPILPVPADEAFMRINPVDTRSEIFYVAMLSNGYRVRSTRSSIPDEGAHQLSFAVAHSGRSIWIETISKGIPQVRGNSPVGTCRIENAETPALSGEMLLAFLREDRGRGSLWTLDLRRCSYPDSATPVRLTPPEFDVRTICPAPHDALLISAFYQGRESVFTILPGESPQLLAEANHRLESPAISPDGKILAIRELIAERWQLELFEISSRTWKQLTRSDCNAYTPSWKDDRTLLYATDCMRGLGLTTMTSIGLEHK